MQRMIRAILFLSLMAMSAGLHSESPVKTGSLRQFSTIIASGELRIGISIFSPWVMRAKDGQLIGSEVDMATRLAADMGLRPVLGLYGWEQLIPALETGEIDIIVSGMGITPRRALRVNFSRPYADAGISVAANIELTTHFKSLADMKRPSVKLGVITETVSARVARRMFAGAHLTTFGSQQLLDKALLKGEIEVMIAANPAPQFLAIRYPDTIDLPVKKPLMSVKEGLAIRKSDIDFLNFIDAWVVARGADNWISSTRHYWHQTLQWQAQLETETQQQRTP